MEPAILIDGLSKRYGNRLALDRLDLRVEPGEIFGFLGPNGAGKTTTIRLLLDLIRPSAGRAAILDFDCRLQSHAVRAVTGYLPGDLRLFPGLTGKETVDLIARLHTRPVEADDGRRLADALDLDLDHHVSVYSKGNRQKLGVVLALLGHPRVLLLDEPTSGLDPLMQQAVWELLRAEAVRGATVFFSSHVISEVEQVCARVAILRAGRLVAVEPIAGLKAHALRRIEVTFEGVPPEPAWRLPGVREIARHQSTVTLEVAGAVDPLIKELGRFTVTDLRTEQPSLDEILLSYYQEDAA